MVKSNIGSVFADSSTTYTGGERVWRETRRVYPGGGRLTTASIKAILGNTAKEGVIPAGTPVTFDSSTKTITLLTSANLAVAENKPTVNGFIKDDIAIVGLGAVPTNDNLFASATVVYEGELYEYMFSATDVTNIKTCLSPDCKVIFVN